MPVLSKQTQILVADEAWVALATLHRKHCQRGSFSPREILDQVKLEHANPELRAGVQAHIYLHNVANAEPNSARYRMFYRLEDDTYRLYRPGDDTHPLRRGKTVPNRSKLPEKYHELLDWYEQEYCKGLTDQQATSIFDQMWGLGKHLWSGNEADSYVAALREGWEQPLLSSEKLATVADRAWERIVEHQGQEFHTKTGLPFAYKIEGDSAVWFFRDGRRINKRLSRIDVEKAIQKCPLEKVTDISVCFDPTYLFALLMDSRIRRNDW